MFEKRERQTTIRNKYRQSNKRKHMPKNRQKDKQTFEKRERQITIKIKDRQSNKRKNRRTNRQKDKQTLEKERYKQALKTKTDSQTNGNTGAQTDKKTKKTFEKRDRSHFCLPTLKVRISRRKLIMKRGFFFCCWISIITYRQSLVI